jgi:hypothetical protein
MRFSTALAAAATISFLTLAGCGGDSDDVPAPPPGDFAITVRHVDGTLPPPEHVEWTLAVDDDAQGKLDYTPDYHGAGVPTFSAQFDVEGAAIADLYDGLVDNDLLRSQAQSGEPPPGGASVSATVTAGGETHEIPAYTDGSAPLAPVERLIRRLVPRQVWDDFAKRRDAYDERRYGKSR